MIKKRFETIFLKWYASIINAKKSKVKKYLCLVLSNTVEFCRKHKKVI